MALVRYLLAVRVARAGGLEPPEAAIGRSRLRAHGATLACTLAQQARDPTFAPFTPADLEPPTIAD